MASRITSEFVKQLNASAIGSRSPIVVNPNGLGSAVARPDTLTHYDPGHGKPRLAAELAWGIIMNHPFADGNKRTAFLAANEFLREKGHSKLFFQREPGEITGSNLEERMGQTIGDAHNRVAKGELTPEGLAKVYKDALRC